MCLPGAQNMYSPALSQCPHSVLELYPTTGVSFHSLELRARDGL